MKVNSPGEVHDGCLGHPALTSGQSARLSVAVASLVAPNETTFTLRT